MAAVLAIEVIYALPDRVWRVPLALPSGATVGDALGQADLASRVPGLEMAGLAVFGQTATPTTLLHDGDRVEILRPLQADPKQARRERARSTPRA